LLKNSRTFVSLCQEVNFLLTAFHDKRAWLPDNGFTTLDDRELEQRLFQSSMLCGIHPRAFAFMIQDRYTLNYWLGCAKYWFTREHQFAPLSDYAPGVVESMLRDTKGSGFRLALPLSELRRLTQEYETFYANSAKSMTNFPDTLIISSIVTDQGFQADPSLYRKIYTNTVFTVYVHNSRE
jgi:hypothetical protein